MHMEDNKNRQARLSVITINKNNAEGLGRTIKSVVNQTYKDFEYIIIDGASNDNSVALIKQHKEYIKIWVSEPDSGIYNAMNKGIKLATGEYCLFLNSGDYLYTDTVLENIFQEPANTDIIACSMISKQYNRYFLNCSPKTISLLTFTNGSLLHPASFIKRDLFEKVGIYDESHRIISDWIFFLEALIIHKCSYASKSDIISVFEAEGGISTLHGGSEVGAMQQIIRSKFPNISLDYYLELPVEYEYMHNIFNVLSKNRRGMRLIKPLLRLINRLAKGRNRNERLISVKRISGLRS